MSVHAYRQKADELLHRAIKTTDLKMRAAVLEQALMWHHLAVEAHTSRSERPQNDDGERDGAAR